ncbi:MAG: hypothetical protein ACP5JJ_09430, partial [Anaerolineae bacterium]
YVGDKTFVLNAGVWTDTTFDPDRLEAVAVSFGSDDYFALIAARPEWGRYFALGDHVIVVLDGTAYEVREGETSSDGSSAVRGGDAGRTGPARRAVPGAYAGNPRPDRPGPGSIFTVKDL